jgi:adenosylcobinamide kinase/adenosylcobinamide-phosphate guanylyltransferase
LSCILIIGGARAGKSRFAQKLAAESGGRVLFVATAEAKDEDMQRRIEEHKRNRPSGWETLEVPVEVSKAVREHLGEFPVVVIDCITMLVSNIMLQARDEVSAEDDVLTEIDVLVRTIAAVPSRFILVSNEVGLGIVRIMNLAGVTGIVWAGLTRCWPKTPTRYIYWWRVPPSKLNRREAYFPPQKMD